MKKKHRLLSLLLAFAMMLTFMPAMAFADDEPEPEPSKVITVKVTPYNANDKCEIDPEEGYDVVLESDGVTAVENDKITITPSQLIRNGNANSGKFTFNYSAVGDYPSAWEGGEIVINVGAQSYSHGFARIGSDSYGYTGNHGLTTQEIRSAFNKEEEKGIVSDRSFTVNGPENTEFSAFTKTIDVVIDYRNTDFFVNGATDLRNPDNVVMFSREGELTRCDNSGSGSTDLNNKNKETWALEKAAPFAKQIEDAVDKAEKAKTAAEESAAAAEAAVNKPGDEAVAAAQKAVDDNLAAQAAVEELEALMTSLNESGDIEYVEKAIDYSGRQGVDEDQKAIADSFKKNKDKAADIQKDYPAELKEAKKRSDAILTQAKSENAEKKADEAAKQASDDKAAAEKAAAEAATYRYKPFKTKVTKVEAAKKSAVVSFKKVPKNVTGYQLRIKDKKTGKVKIVKVKKSTKKVINKKIKGLKKNRKYSVKVRAYHTVKDKTYYAGWSKAKGFKTKK